MSAEPRGSLGGGGAAEAAISVSHRMGAAVAVLQGEIDISNVADVRRALIGIDDIGAGLVIDLSPVDFMDSSAISLLHEFAERVRQRGQQVLVVCPPETPSRRMLELTGLGERVVLLERVSDGLERLTRPL
jgi:anti-anti-sigma factor